MATSRCLLRCVLLRFCVRSWVKARRRVRERRTLLLPDELKDAIVIDGHADTPQRFVDEAWEFNGPLNDGHLNLETARQGGLAAEFFAIWVQPGEWHGRYAHRTLQLI